MSLTHEFILIDKKGSDNSSDSLTNKVILSDNFVRYIDDCFQWISTWWNDKEERKGLNYYGYSVIKEYNIIQFEKIIEAWIGIFEIAPEQFILTGDYLVEENKYEKICYQKQNILSNLLSLRNLCKKAIKENKYILHNGI